MDLPATLPEAVRVGTLVRGRSCQIRLALRNIKVSICGNFSRSPDISEQHPDPLMALFWIQR